jgi:hypothetical protein
MRRRMETLRRSAIQEQLPQSTRVQPRQVPRPIRRRLIRLPLILRRVRNSILSRSSSPSNRSRPNISSRNISSRNIKINKTKAIPIRVTRTRLPSTLPSLLRRCRSINSRHAPNQTTCGRRATGPTLRLATIGFLECGPSLPMLGRSGLRDTGITIQAATDSTKAIGDVTSATTAA